MKGKFNYKLKEDKVRKKRIIITEACKNHHTFETEDPSLEINKW